VDTVLIGSCLSTHQLLGQICCSNFIKTYLTNFLDSPNMFERIEAFASLGVLGTKLTVSAYAYMHTHVHMYMCVTGNLHMKNLAKLKHKIPIFGLTAPFYVEQSPAVLSPTKTFFHGV
jgi:hypothetical protein